MVEQSPYLTAYVGEIGKLVFSVSMLDDQLSNLLSECFGLSELQENALLRPMNTRARIDLLGRVAKLFLSGDELKSLTAWCTTAKDKLDERNALVHGQPGQEGGEVTFRLFSGNKGIFGQAEVWSMDRVCDLRDYWITAALEFEEKIRPAFLAWIEETRGERRPQPDAEQTPPEE